MKNSLRWITPSSVTVAALLCLVPCATVLAQSYTIRPTCSPNGQCTVNPATFGFNDTNWRQWPVQPRPEQTNSRTIGATGMPTPAPILEQPLPHAEGLPAKPPLSEENKGGAILPFSGSTPDLKIGGGTAAGPSNPKPNTPGGPNPLAPQGLKGIPEGLDLIAPQPKAEGGTIQSPGPPKENLLPEGRAPEILTPTPGTPAAKLPTTPDSDILVPKSPKTPDTDIPAPKSPKTPDTDVPAPKSPVLPPELEPSPALKPDVPTKGASFSRRRRDAIAARATAIPNAVPMQANWNALLEPEVVGGNPLRSTSFEQPLAETNNPLRRAWADIVPSNFKKTIAGLPATRTFKYPMKGKYFIFPAPPPESDSRRLRRNMPRHKTAMISSWRKKRIASCPAA